jgi:N-acetylglucosaminyldiphosphoundecaprenol N-acetyl-beta-D-mannosaminyltransferase
VRVARRRILTTSVLPVSAREAAEVVMAWAEEPVGRVMCAANVHMVMEAWSDPMFSDELARADLVFCDGRPLLWFCRLSGDRRAKQARGLDVMLNVCDLAVRHGLPVGLYGGRPEVLAAVEKRLRAGFADVDIRYRYSPPFRPLSAEEDEQQTEAIKAAGVRVLLVALGCPKQERWMIEHRDRLPVTMLGIGAAVDFVIGAVQPAPRIMQSAGLEWVHRLFSEPGRLWKRYARTNTRFVILATSQLLRESREHRVRLRGGGG